MSNGEKLERSQPINLREVPEGVLRDIVNHMRSLATKEDWERLTRTWNILSQNLARQAREMSQSERNKAARGIIQEITPTLEEEEESEHDAALILSMALLCLSDQQLDLAVASFTPTKH